MARILLIDDDVDLAGELVNALERAGHSVTSLERAERGPDLLVRQEFDLVLLDNKMPGMSGIDFLTALNERELRVPVILMTSFATADTAIRAVNLGACDYLEKPDTFELLWEELNPLIATALEIDWRPKQVVQVPGETPPDGSAGAPLLGKSKPMLELYVQIGRVARGHMPVLIRGETGTGKELVARAIHTNSPRKNRPFVPMNCTAFNENLLEDELFGHEPHAFTGADKLRKGRFEHANGGTLFLDEVGDMPSALQAKLLRVLENQEVTRIGGNEPLKVDVRVLSATHRDLESAIRDGTFREDLFYRLNGIAIRLPALRARGVDLPLLVSHFLDQAAQGTGRRAPTLHPSAWHKLRAHTWPGNIRELRNVLSSAVLMCPGSQIMPCDLKLWGGAPEPAPATPAGKDEALAGLRQAIHWAWNAGQPNLCQHLQDLLERELLQHALAALDGNRSRVAERLNMNRGTVIKRLQAYGLE